MTPFANLYEKIKATEPRLRAKAKGIEIAKIGPQMRTQRNECDIEIVSFNAIEKGIEVFVRAWDSNGQIGFGKDGTVDIERFVIINPPILIDDDNGDIIKTSTHSETGVATVRKLKEDTKEAVLQVLEHAIKVIPKFGSGNVVIGKIGSTTTTVFPDAHVETDTFDGSTTHEGNASWDTAHDAASGTAASAANSPKETTSRDRGADYSIARCIYLVDTSGISASDMRNLFGREEESPMSPKQKKPVS